MQLVAWRLHVFTGCHCGRVEKHLAGLAEWNAPSAGMFLWIRLLAGVTDADQIFELLKDARVVVVPGACPAVSALPCSRRREMMALRLFGYRSLGPRMKG